MIETNEWAWFRASLRAALFRPRTFARTLRREHYGLAGILVALIAGLVLSVSVDAAVVLSKGADPLAYLSRLLVDAVLLGVRMCVTIGVVGLVVVGAARLRRQPTDLDQAYTAVAFAAAALVFAPLAPLLLALGGELAGPVRVALLVLGGVVAAAILARFVFAIGANLVALVGAREGVLLTVVAVAALGLTLIDQVDRLVFTTFTYAPELLPAPAARPSEGSERRVEVLSFRLPDDWAEASRGIPGEAGRYERADARLIVRRASVSPLATADSYAETQVGFLRRDFSRLDASARALVDVDGTVAVDDRWYGSIGEVHIAQRSYFVVLGLRAYQLEFRFFSPRSDADALETAAEVAASIRVARR